MTEIRPNTYVLHTEPKQREREREMKEGKCQSLREPERDEQRLMENKGTHLNLNWELRDDGNKSRLISRT